MKKSHQKKITVLTWSLVERQWPRTKANLERARIKARKGKKK